MNWLNPLRCTTESTRRLSIGLLIVASLAWVIWVGVKSDGFSTVTPVGWVVLVVVPLSFYMALALLAVLPIRKTSKEVRVLLSMNLMWAFLLGCWGFIWEWENVFTLDQYLGLFVFPVISTWLGLILWKWSRSAPSVSFVDSSVILEDGQQHQTRAPNMTAKFCKGLKRRLEFTADHGRLRLFAIGIGISLLLALSIHIPQTRKGAMYNDINYQISASIGEVSALCEASMHVATNYCHSLALKDDFKNTCTSGIVSLIPHSMPNRIEAVIATETAIASDDYKLLVNDIKAKIDKVIATAKQQPNYSKAVLCNNLAADYNNNYDQLILKLSTIKFK